MECIENTIITGFKRKRFVSESDAGSSSTHDESSASSSSSPPPPLGNKITTRSSKQKPRRPLPLRSTKGVSSPSQGSEKLDTSDASKSKSKTKEGKNDVNNMNCLVSAIGIIEGLENKSLSPTVVQTNTNGEEGKENSDPVKKNNAKGIVELVSQHVGISRHRAPPAIFSPLGSIHNQDQTTNQDSLQLSQVDHQMDTGPTKNKQSHSPHLLPIPGANTVEQMLVATNAELRRKHCQFEQQMVQQANQIRDLHAKLQNQATEHNAAVMKLKEEESRRMLVKTTNETKERIQRLQDENDAQKDALKKKFDEQMKSILEEKDAQLETLKKELETGQSERAKDKQIMQSLVKHSAEQDTLNKKCEARMKNMLKEKDVELETFKKELETVRSESKKEKQMMESNSQRSAAKIKEQSEALDRYRLEHNRKESLLRTENNKLKKEISKMLKTGEKTTRIIDDKERLVEILRKQNYDIGQRLGESKQYFEQQLNTAQQQHNDKMNSFEAMLQNALQQQRSFSSEKQQLNRDKRAMQQTIGCLETSLEEMEQELEQLKLNHAMQIGLMPSADEEED
ncbi:unnamed protein product [Cylindrotheca closterium]|uniref:Uncharacterized protein n=1 Tax=Cylindrotheca closterium TaxID=2856 RepID=A0AAD2JGP7_9STRA|nr:unnamed protein product [Cylindrotheca closterium]